MAIEVYGLTYTDVLPSFPFNTSNIGASSALTPTHIAAHIEAGASRVTAALARAGLSASSLDDDQTKAVQDAIIKYAVWQGLNKIGWMRGLDQFRQDWYDALDALRVNARSTVGASSSTDSNVPVTTRRTTPARKFTADGTKW